jgi:hypothetical protein
MEEEGGGSKKCGPRHQVVRLKNAAAALYLLKAHARVRKK